VLPAEFDRYFGGLLKERASAYGKCALAVYTAAAKGHLLSPYKIASAAAEGFLPESLGGRERNIAALLQSGLTEDAVSEKLDISVEDVLEAEALMFRVICERSSGKMCGLLLQ
jgi:hypothetical protein